MNLTHWLTHKSVWAFVGCTVENSTSLWRDVLGCCKRNRLKTQVLHAASGHFLSYYFTLCGIQVVHLLHKPPIVREAKGDDTHSWHFIAHTLSYVQFAMKWAFLFVCFKITTENSYCWKIQRRGIKASMGWGESKQN